jgi:hypothetical protein
VIDRPPLPQRLPDPEFRDQLNQEFRRALSPDDSERKAGEYRLWWAVQTPVANNPQLSGYATWLLQLLDWSKDHPNIPIVLPGESSGNSASELNFESELYRFQLECNRRFLPEQSITRQRQRSEDHPSDGFAIFGMPEPPDGF